MTTVYVGEGTYLFSSPYNGNNHQRTGTVTKDDGKSTELEAIGLAKDRCAATLESDYVVESVISENFYAVEL